MRPASQKKKKKTLEINHGLLYWVFLKTKREKKKKKRIQRKNTSQQLEVERAKEDTDFVNGMTNDSHTLMDRQTILSSIFTYYTCTLYVFLYNCVYKMKGEEEIGMRAKKFPRDWQRPTRHSQYKEENTCIYVRNARGRGMSYSFFFFYNISYPLYDVQVYI